MHRVADISIQHKVRYGRLWTCDPPLHVVDGHVHYQSEVQIFPFFCLSLKCIASSFLAPDALLFDLCDNLQAEEVTELFQHRCVIQEPERQPLGETTVRIGQVVGPIDSNQTVPALVREVKGSLRQTLAMNPSRIDVISKHPLVADMLHPQGDGRLCLVSSLSEECSALPY